MTEGFSFVTGAILQWEKETIYEKIISQLRRFLVVGDLN